MKKICVKITAILIVIIAFPAFNGQAKANSLNLLPNDEVKIENAITQQLQKKIKKGAFFLLGIESKIKEQREELSLLRSNMTALESKIEESKVKIEDLNSQVSNLDRMIAKNQKRIAAVEVQKARHENTIYRIEREIIDQSQKLKDQAESLNEALTAYYLQTNAFFDADSSTPSLLAFLSSDKTTGEILRENDYLYFLQKASQDLAKNIIFSTEALDEKKEVLKSKKITLGELQTILTREKRTLNESKQSRQRLLDDTKGRQAIYETLLELAKKEEEQVGISIARLKDNYDFFQKRLDELQANPDAAKFTFDDLSLDEENQLLKGEADLAWPVNPALGISAIYRDSAYEKALGIRHNGIDIRITQGSKIKTAADGVVTKVADNGFSYSYVIIAHPNKILTVYGHLSEILVTEGEIVRQGQTIGLSGGIPGTKGAGWLTTGAHLHFEALVNFTYADPLEHLPLEYVPIASLPEKYLKKLTGEDTNKVRRAE